MKPTKTIKLISMFGLLAIFLAACTTPQTTATQEANPLENFVPGVNATGIIVPEQFASLSITTAGVVEEVFINEGDLVEEGQLLIQIKGGEQAQAAVTGAQLELTNAQNFLDTLYENTDLIAANALKTAEDTEDALEDLQNRELQEALALKAIADAQKAVENTERSYNYSISTADEADIELQRAQVTLAKDALDKALEDYEPYADKPETNLVRANLLARKAAAQQAYDDAVRKLNALLGTGSDADISVAEANFATAQAQLIQAQRDWERVQEGPSAGDIAVLEAQIASSYEDYEIYKDGPDPADVAVAEARIANAEAQLAAAQSALDDLQLLAPFAGTISELNIKASEWVSPGQPVIILADLNNLQVETTDLSEIDVARIAVGDTAILTFDALPDSVEGIVTRISPKSAQGSGVNYTVTIDMSSVPDGLRWGMTAFVDVELEGE
ncbi:MAG: HlyD family efflux transporter periplasmic adaptor subunit [Anaerolineae bacterium]|nr:HlyD family efflux transporter periplasmic adaptor subunit [Anaerolineae bacterium]